MPYKDPEEAKAARRRHYQENKARYAANRQRLREQPGYRDVEYAQRRAEAAAARGQDPAPALEVVPARRRTPKEEREHVEAERFRQTQRDLKAQALARLANAKRAA